MRLVPGPLEVVQVLIAQIMILPRALPRLRVEEAAGDGVCTTIQSNQRLMGVCCVISLIILRLLRINFHQMRLLAIMLELLLLGW